MMLKFVVGLPVVVVAGVAVVVVIHVLIIIITVVIVTILAFIIAVIVILNAMDGVGKVGLANQEISSYINELHYIRFASSHYIT